MTILEVKNLKGNKQTVSYPSDHKRVGDIKRWLANGLSPGYIEYLLKFDKDPHCNACRDFGCESAGHAGDDACKAFKYGDDW